MKLCEMIEEMGERPHMCVAFVGAGGKTGCILELAQQWKKQGKKVLVTTSAHMENPKNFPLQYITEDDGEAICALLKREGAAAAGLPVKEGLKIGPLSRRVYEQAAAEADCVLLEADGSRRFPMKVPGKQEPVLYEDTTHVFILAGASALGKSLRQVCHRIEEAEKFLETEAGQGKADRIVTEELLGILLEQGYVRRLQQDFPQGKLAVILNQTDVLQNPEQSRKKLQARLSVPVFLHGWSKAVHGIVLAAGFSRRFGENKLLYEIEGKPMYQFLMNRLLHLREKSRLQTLTVVTQYEEIRQYAEEQRITAVENPHSNRGISSSLRLGLRCAMEKSRKEKENYYLFFVADQPFLTERTVEEFVSAFLKTGKGIGCLCKEGIAGNPVMFHQKYVEELLELTGDMGGKRVLRHHLEDVFYYEVSNERELRDLDRKEAVETGLPL
ncbi:MAG TPA: putative selenium-dependent hydroxylase accessory protein YqeC [Candidatus Blautia stercoravium]|nr:putative selenium-dependent hydroxylase accessory protein YqeC [Candidatus Blautia stercoravium]